MDKGLVYLSGSWLIGWEDDECLYVGNYEKREDYFLRQGYDVVNPYGVWGDACCDFLRWVYGIWYLIRCDLVVFPSWWRYSIYGVLDRFLSFVLCKAVVISDFD